MIFNSCIYFDYRIVRCISRDFQTLIWALKTYLGLYTEYEMLIIELKLKLPPMKLISMLIH